MPRGVELSRSHDPGTQCKSPTWVAVVQTYEPFSAAFPSALVGRWMESGAVKTQTGTHVGFWFEGDSLTCSTRMLAASNLCIFHKAFENSSIAALSNCLFLDDFYSLMYS